MTGVLAFYERVDGEVRVRIGREWVRVPEQLQEAAYRAIGSDVEAQINHGALVALAAPPLPPGEKVAA